MTIKKITIQDSVPIVFGLVLISIIIAIAIKVFLDMQRETPTTNQTSTITPAVTDTSFQTVKDIAQEPRIYDQQAQDRLMAKIETRTSLSESDRLAKNRILSAIPDNQGYGILYETEKIRIDYTRSQDLFQVEILTTELNSAKGEGNAWFREQGMSQEGICNHPVDFYLSWEVKQQLEGKIVSFSPLAPNCK